MPVLVYIIQKWQNNKGEIVVDAEVLRKINQAKITLMTTPNTVFFSSLLSYLKIVIDPKCGTAWTDAIHLGLDPKFVKKCTSENLVAVFMHELGHVIFEHIQIALENLLLSKEHNIAGDHYINLWLKEMKYVLPSFIDFYCDPKYKRWSSMRIYADLLKNPPLPKTSGMGFDIRLPKGMSKDEHKERVIGNIVKATMQAQMSNEYGSVPGHIKRIVKDVVAPSLPWQQILANAMNAYTRNDYSLRRPNKKYVPDFYLPTLHSETLEHIICAKDVSGSITDNELAQIDAEERYIWDTLHPTTMRSITFDTKIRQNTIYEQGDTLPASILTGGGGTNVKPILKYVREEDPKITLIFTDGFFAKPDLAEITNDIYWIVKGNKNFKTPHGTVIHF